MTRYVQIEFCAGCPYCRGLDPDLLVGWEELTCAHRRMTSPGMGEEFVNTDQYIGKYYRSEGIYDDPEVNPPDWCPLPEEVFDIVTPKSKIRIVRI